MHLKQTSEIFERDDKSQTRDVVGERKARSREEERGARKRGRRAHSTSDDNFAVFAVAAECCSGCSLLSEGGEFEDHDAAVVAEGKSPRVVK